MSGGSDRTSVWVALCIAVTLVFAGQKRAIQLSDWFLRRGR
jgi:hypothetical protein